MARDQNQHAFSRGLALFAVWMRRVSPLIFHSLCACWRRKQVSGPAFKRLAGYGSIEFFSGCTKRGGWPTLSRVAHPFAGGPPFRPVLAKGGLSPSFPRFLRKGWDCISLSSFTKRVPIPSTLFRAGGPPFRPVLAKGGLSPFAFFAKGWIIFLYPFTKRAPIPSTLFAEETMG